MKKKAKNAPSKRPMKADAAKRDDKSKPAARQPKRRAVRSTARTIPRRAVPAAKARPAAARSIRKPKPKVPLPPALLEPESFAPPGPSGPGERFVLGLIKGPSKTAALSSAAALPEGYGTERLFLTARDPHWLYACWDLNPEQRQRYISAAKGGALVLRVFGETDALVSEIALGPEAGSWFVHVGKGGSRYRAELGYYGETGEWRLVSRSADTFTPPETMSPDQTAQFVTLPLGIGKEELWRAVRGAMEEHPPVISAVQQPGQPAATVQPGQPELPPTPREQARRERIEAIHRKEDRGMAKRYRFEPESLPSAAAPATGPSAVAKVTKRGGRSQEKPADIAPPVRERWTAAQARALEKLLRLDEHRRVWIGSLEVTEMIRRQLAKEVSSAAWPGLPAAGMEERAVPGISSPQAAPRRRRRGFWMNINAELVIYGATERSAVVTIGGRTVRLRPDGSFSFRFSLPDGQYQLPIRARAADAEDFRQAVLQFSRATEVHGEVAAHPQSHDLRPPLPENIR